MNRVREWNPGDVALTKSGGTVARTAQHRWVLLDDGHDIDIEDERIARPLAVIDIEDERIARPLAVIDFEDREQVERLASLFADRLATAGDTRIGLTDDAMQAALREFANPKPPKPEEPTGLGAVVEDEDGDLWLLVHPGAGPFHWARKGEVVGNWHQWGSIDAVKVLSDGIPA